jgi:hypothetical protein
MAITPVQSTVTVTTAGTRVRPNSDTSILPTTIYFEALGTNTGNIYIGLSNVSSTSYIARLSAGQAVCFSSDHTGSSAVTKDSVCYQLSNFYVDSSVSGEAVQVTYSRG